MNLGEVFKPQEGQAVRFCTTQSLGTDLRQHGINGFFRDGRFWSVDMADHWAPREITNWEATDGVAGAQTDEIGNGALASGLTAPPAPQPWRGLTEEERDIAVNELVEYGTEFVAPLYAVVESIERKLKERNAGVNLPDGAKNG
jgi:hypothetical protein